MEQRPVAKSRLIPAQAFDHERHYLVKLPAQLPAPYLAHERDTDQYGYAAFDGNYYWPLRWAFRVGELGLIASVVFHAVNGVGVILYDLWPNGALHRRRIFLHH